MCGIAGYTTYNNKEKASQETLSQMGQAILHRGPDAGGYFIDDNVGLCHRRLSIIDLSSAGNQPMTSHDSDFVIVFNGEIYNFLELRAELLEQNYPFKTHTDTEVILALYQQYGQNCLDKLNGMFAFAIWDIKKQSLFIARDRLGKKPLYYFVDDGNIYFASELKSLMVLPNIPKDIRVDAVFDFFAYQYIPDPKTIFKGVHKLLPGHCLTLTNEKLTTEQYWDVSFSKTRSQDEQSIGTNLFDLVKSCTESRMVSDVPLGAFLSGGVDSSGIVAMMSTLAKAKGAETVTTCSVGFDNEKYNEVEFAKAVAEQYHTDHHEFTVHENVKDNLEQIVSYFDEPFADPSLVPTYFVSALARQKVTVAIAGDGGDEVFAGYQKYAIDDIENRLRKKIPRWLRKSIFPPLAATAGLINLKPFKKAKSLLTSLSVEPAMGFYMSNSMITDELWQFLANRETKQSLNGYHPASLTLAAYDQADGEDHLSKILYTDMKTYLPGGILVKVDRMSMANSLEVRAPLLDYTLVEYAASIPSALKFDNGEKKKILKDILKPLLPDEILYRKKMGFSVPLAQWLREELKEFTYQRLFARDSGLVDYFEPSAIKELWQRHQNGSYDYSTPLWSMLMFQMWWDNYMAN